MNWTVLQMNYRNQNEGDGEEKTELSIFGEEYFD